jgi:hypothetical protein
MYEGLSEIIFAYDEAKSGNQPLSSMSKPVEFARMTFDRINGGRG